MELSSDADLGDMLIVLDVTALDFAQIINMRMTGPWETNWIVISSEEATTKPVCLLSVMLQNVNTRRGRDTV